MVKAAAILLNDRLLAERLKLILVNSPYRPQIYRDGVGLAQQGIAPDIVLIDPAGFTALRERDPAGALRLSRQTHLILLLSIPELLDATEILSLVDGWIFTDVNLDRIVPLIALGEQRHSLLPEQFLSPDGMDHIRMRLLGRLSPTEHLCLLQLGYGMNNRDIARILDLSEPATKSTVRATLGKLHFRNRTEAGVFAARNAGALASLPAHRHH